MRRVTILVAAVLVLLASTLAGVLPYEHRFTADAGLRFYDGGNATSFIDALADGNATIRFYRDVGSVYTGTYTDSFTVWVAPNAAGDSLQYLRQDIPRHWLTSNYDIDSVYVDVDTATEVILTWY